ncbi:MAG: formate dehydrogenase accessory sulfurtransferase FdhD [Longimicrobiales bacterium]
MNKDWAPEAPVWFEVNGGRRIVTTCTPDDMHAFTAGYLLSEDYIRHATEIEEFDIAETVPAIGVRVKVSNAGAIRVGVLHRHIRENGCGPLHYVTCDPATLCQDRPLGIPSENAFREIFRALYAAGDAAYPDGGMHTAALSDGEKLHFVMTDIGRHNAVDKTIGRGLLAGAELPSLGLVITARISGAIVVKAARAGLSWIASRSIPTTLAVSIAEAAHLPIIARAASKDAQVIGAAGGTKCPPTQTADDDA